MEYLIPSLSLSGIAVIETSEFAIEEGYKPDFENTARFRHGCFILQF